MRTSSDRILTTHVGSLPRSQAVTDVVFGRERGEQTEATGAPVIAAAVKEIVARQADVGVDVVSDGEMSKISYATYIKDRITGFDGDTPREPGLDLIEFPRVMKQLAESGATARYRRPRCVGPIAVKSLGPVTMDLANLQSALAAVGAGAGAGARTAARPVEAFMNAASPGVIAFFQPNDYYPTQDAYLEAVADAMRAEYEAIAASGVLLQIDAPDFGMGRHTLYKQRTAEEYLSHAAIHVEVLNHALRNVPAERARMHICWGNYAGPHHHDIPLEQLLPVVVKAKPQALLFEAANPRHEHEWTVFREQPIPADKILIPGVISTTTNYVEHPLLVAERLCRYADAVGAHRVMAGTDCGFGTFAGFGPVDPDVAFMKLAALADGAAIASRRL
ncbi:MAG: cobalamin-independent methionine synthase II family protein, partial [Steroidobacteraceae bacterium]